MLRIRQVYPNLKDPTAAAGFGSKEAMEILRIQTPSQCPSEKEVTFSPSNPLEFLSMLQVLSGAKSSQSRSAGFQISRAPGRDGLPGKGGPCRLPRRSNAVEGGSLAR